MDHNFPSSLNKFDQLKISSPFFPRQYKLNWKTSPIFLHAIQNRRSFWKWHFLQYFNKWKKVSNRCYTSKTTSKHMKIKKTFSIFIEVWLLRATDSSPKLFQKSDPGAICSILFETRSTRVCIVSISLSVCNHSFMIWISPLVLIISLAAVHCPDSSSWESKRM